MYSILCVYLTVVVLNNRLCTPFRIPFLIQSFTCYQSARVSTSFVVNKRFQHRDEEVLSKEQEHGQRYGNLVSNGEARQKQLCVLVIQDARVRCHGNPRGCVEMGQDHGGLESRNQGSEEKDYVLRVGPETVGKQRSIARERERDRVRYSCADKGADRDVVNNLY